VEADGDCPYLTKKEASDTEGNIVGRTTTVSTVPVGCNFFLGNSDGHMTLKISTQTFRTPVEAYNAMVAAGGANPNGVKNLIPGVDPCSTKPTSTRPTRARTGRAHLPRAR
jgi:hypothetical protein